MRANVPVRLQDGFPLVTAEVGGRAVTLLLDTGSHGLLLLPDAVARLRLRPDLGQTTHMQGTGGAREVPNAVLPGLTLGGAPLPGGSVPVTAFPVALTTEPPMAGVLGANLLRSYDVDLDVQAGRMTLLAPTGCAPDRGTAITLQSIPGDDWALTVLANGIALLALPDTGTRITLLSNQAARRLGLDAPVTASTARGLDGRRVPLRHLPLRSLQVGADVSHDMPVSVTDLQIAPAEVLLGLDWFRQHRVWLSYAGGMMVVRPPQ